MSLISNKNVQDKNLRGIKRYKNSAILIGILIILFFLMDLPRLVSQDIFKILNENTCDFRHNWIYKLLINFIFILLISIILAINYLIIVPYYVIKFKIFIDGKKGNLRVFLNGDARTPNKIESDLLESKNNLEGI